MSGWWVFLIAAVGLLAIPAARILAGRAAGNDDTAPGWTIRCLTCNRQKPAAQAGIVRRGAAGTKYTLVRCRNCQRIRWAAIEQPEVQPESASDSADLET